MTDTVKTGTIITLPKCGVDIVINEIKVDDNDEALLNVDYDFDETKAKKEDVDAEISEIILSALEEAVKDKN